MLAPRPQSVERRRGSARASSPPRLGITLITPGFSEDETDACIPALRTLVGALAQRAEVRVLTLHYPYRAGRYALAGAEVRALGGANAQRLSRAVLLTRAIAAVILEQRRNPVNVLHGVWADEAGLVAVTAGRLLSLPAVVSLAGGELIALRDIGYGGASSRLRRGLLHHVLRRADRVTVGSASLERLAASHVPADRLLRLPLAVDMNLFAPGRAPTQSPFGAGPIRLLAVGSLTPVKDHATLLRAFAIVAAHVPRVHLDVVGDGPLLGALRAQAGAVTGASVTFHGAVRHEELPPYYRAADLVVVSSRFESQSMVAVEAAACGRPIAGTAVGVLPELPGAVTVPAGDAVALAEAVVDAISDPEELDRRGRANLEAGGREYALQHVADRFCALYDEVASV